MGKAGDVRAGGAYVEVGGDVKTLANVMKKGKEELRSFAKFGMKIGAAFIAVGAAIALPLKKAVDEFALYGDEFAKMSKRTGMSSKSLSEFGHAATLAGADAGAFEKGLRGMQRGLFDAARGSLEIVEGLEVLGLSYEQLKDLSPQDQFMTIGDRLSRVQHQSIKTAIAMKLFGRAGSQLIPLYYSRHPRSRRC